MEDGVDAEDHLTTDEVGEVSALVRSGSLRRSPSTTGGVRYENDSGLTGFRRLLLLLVDTGRAAMPGASVLLALATVSMATPQGALVRLTLTVASGEITPSGSRPASPLSRWFKHASCSIAVCTMVVSIDSSRWCCAYRSAITWLLDGTMPMIRRVDRKREETFIEGLYASNFDTNVGLALSSTDCLRICNRST